MEQLENECGGHVKRLWDLVLDEVTWRVLVKSVA